MPTHSSHASAPRIGSFELCAIATGLLLGAGLMLFEGIGRGGEIAPPLPAAVALSGAALSLQVRRNRLRLERSLTLALTLPAIALALAECARHASAAGAVLLLTAGSLLARRWKTPPSHTQSRLAEIAMQHANDAMFLFDEQMQIVETNQRAATLYGYTREELLVLSASDLRIPEKQSTTAADFSSAHHSSGFLFETLHRTRNGTAFPVEVSARPLEIDGRRYVLSVVRDVTERKAQQEEIERLNRMYLVISQVNQTIVRARARETMLAEICEILIKFGHFKIAWVGWLNPASQLLEPKAIAGDTHGYLTGLRISVDASLPEGRGPSGQAFRSGTPYVCNDFFNDPATVPWRERATKSGFHSSIALPLTQEGSRIGLLTVYAAEKDFFVPGKIALLEEAAGDISFCLDVFASDERRHQAEAALKASEGRLGFLLSATPAVIYSLRATGDFATTFISENVQQVLGYSPEDFTADSGFWFRHLHPDDARVLGGAFGTIPHQRTIRREYRFRHTDGSYRWMHDNLRLINDAAGQPKEYVGYWLDITHRKEAEESLRSREEIFSSIVDQAPDAIALVDNNTGRFAEFNKAAYEGLGYTREEFAGLSIADIQADHDTATIRQNLRKILEEGRLSFETRHRHRNGEVRDVEVSARAITVLKRDYITAVWSDITDRKAMAEKLRSSEELYRLIAENTTDIIWVYDPAAQHFTYVSPAVERMLGYTRQDVLASDLTGILTPESAAEANRTLAARLASVAAGNHTELHHIGIYDHVHKHGGVRIGEVVTSLLLDPTGRPHLILGVTRDITSRRAAEAEVQKLSLVVEQNPASIVITDLTGSIEYVNPHFTKTTGYTREEVIGKNPRLFKSGVTASAVYAGLWHTVTAGGVWHGEIVNRKKNGELHTELVTIAPVTDARGHPTHFVALKQDITERKQFEAMLRKLSRTIEQAPLSVAITDLSGTIEYVNPHFSKVTGYTLEEAIGQNPRVLKSGLTPANVYTDMWLTLTAGRVWHGELHNRKKNGEHYVETAVIAPVVDEQGHPTHYVALKEDITERKRTEAALHEAQERYRLIAENTGDVIWLYDLTRDEFTFVSPSVTRFLGFAGAEIIGRKMSEILVPASSTRTGAALAERLARLAAGDETARIAIDEVEQFRKDGRIVPSEVMTALLSDATGRPTQILGVSRDITERRRNEAALQRFNAELEQKVILRTAELATRNREIQALLDAIPDLVMRLRADGTMLNYHAALNSSGLATIATPFDGAGGTLNPQLTAPAMEAGLRALASATVVVQEITLEGPAGTVAVELRVAPLGDDQFVAFVRDISARKRLETETAAMLERERQVSEMKTRFISVTSHEFRTPLAAVMGSVELIRNHFDRLSPAKREEIFERIRHAMRRLTEMLDDVLTLSRMDSGRIDLQLTEVNLRLLTHSIVEECQIADRGAHHYTVEIDGEGETLRTNSSHLHHILSNLLSNAARYSPEGTTITTHLQLADQCVVLSVTDEGIGIPPDDRHRIFQPFERASNVGTVKGTGLGLNIVKRMTELLGGTISLEPGAVRGTRFTVDLPRLAAPAP